MRQEAAQQLEAARAAAAQARAQTEQQSARWVRPAGCLPGRVLPLLEQPPSCRDAPAEPCPCPACLPPCLGGRCRKWQALTARSPPLASVCRESAEALSAAIEREAELRAALAEAGARYERAAAGAGHGGRPGDACMCKCSPAWRRPYALCAGAGEATCRRDGKKTLKTKRKLHTKRPAPAPQTGQTARRSCGGRPPPWSSGCARLRAQRRRCRAAPATPRGRC